MCSRRSGVGDDLAHTSIRFGLGRWSTEEEVDYVADKLTNVVTRLREMSPLYEMAKEGVDLSTMQWAQRKDSTDMAYSDKVIDHYENPRNVGSLPKEDPNVGTGLVGAPECGDVMKLQVKVNPDTGVIDDAKFKTFGCGSRDRQLEPRHGVGEGQDG